MSSTPASGPVSSRIVSTTTSRSSVSVSCDDAIEMRQRVVVANRHQHAAGPRAQLIEADVRFTQQLELIRVLGVLRLPAARAVTRSEVTNRPYSSSVNAMPDTVAVCFVNRLMTAHANSDTRDQAEADRESRVRPTVTFSGTFHSRGTSRSLKRSTSIASDLNAKLQTTPNAYASPST